MKRGKLSASGVAAKTGLNRFTITNIIQGTTPTPESIGKLAAGFADGPNEIQALTDHLLVLAGYRTERPEGDASEEMARLRDKVSGFSDAQLIIMTEFADFLIEIKSGPRKERNPPGESES